MGSISSPILISITRGRAAELEAGLVCAFASRPTANSARINGTKSKATSGFRMRRENKRAGKELREKEEACAVNGNPRASAGTQRRHIPASLYQSARRLAETPGATFLTCK
jgi:hypothetical protein